MRRRAMYKKKGLIALLCRHTHKASLCLMGMFMYAACIFMRSMYMYGYVCVGVGMSGCLECIFLWYVPALLLWFLLCFIWVVMFSYSGVGMSLGVQCGFIYLLKTPTRVQHQLEVRMMLHRVGRRLMNYLNPVSHCVAQGESVTHGYIVFVWLLMSNNPIWDGNKIFIHIHIHLC